MAFNDLPQIDEPSEHDDEAQNRFEGIFSQKAGFICRDQRPDKGCDYMVELIQEKRATMQQFAVQLKSVDKASLVDKGQFISFPWLTSRLAYLLRNTPVYGLLIIYDVSRETCFYEYIEKIYSRLMDRPTDKWKDNEKVNVHVPVANVLDSSAAVAIHRVFNLRFENIVRMSNDHAKDYDLPNLKMNFATGYNLDKIDDVVEVLIRWGVSSILINDIPLIFDLLSKIPNNKIVERKDLSILATLANSEVGKIADSQFYLSRLRRRFELTAGEEQMVRFIELKNQLALGEISGKDFVAAIDEFLGQKVSRDNEITLRLNKLNFQLKSIRGFHKIPVNLADEIAKLAEVIEGLEESSNKYFLKLWNLENLSVLTGLIRTQNINEFAIREQFGNPISTTERLEGATMIVGMQILFSNEIKKIDRYANETQNLLLRAFAILAKSNAELSLEIDLIVSGTNPKTLSEHGQWLTNAIATAAEGFHIFIDQNQLSQAYTLLCISHELHVIATEWGHWHSPVNEGMLAGNFKLLEKELELQPFQSKVRILISRRASASMTHENPNNGMRFILQLDEEQIETAVEMTLKTGKFPNARKEFMLMEMHSFKLFFQRCDDTNIYPIIANPPPIEEVYRFPLSYQLVNAQTGEATPASTDMDLLLKSWGF